MQEEELKQIYRFIIRLGKETYSYGVSSFRLKQFLNKLSIALGVEGHFLFTQKYIYFVFMNQDERQFSYLLPIEARSYDMNKLQRVSELVNCIANGELSLKEATEKLDAISTTPKLYGKVLVGAGYLFSGAGFALLLSAQWSDVAVSVLTSLITYLLIILLQNKKKLSKSAEFISALAVSSIASIIAVYYPGSDPFVTTLCGVIVLVPGLSLTVGLAELAAGMVVSGMQTIVSAILVLFRLFAGAIVGSAIVGIVHEVPIVTYAAYGPSAMQWLGAGLLMLSLSVIFTVPVKDISWAIVGGLVAFGGVVIGNDFGYWQGSFLGALILGTYAFIYSRSSGRSTSVIMLTGIMILVPGAASYIGLHLAHSSGTATGLEAEWKAFVNALAVTAGLLAAYTVLPWKNDV